MPSMRRGRMKSLSFVAGAVSTMDLGFLCFCLWQRIAPEILKSLEHAYSLREELDSTWAARPIAIVHHWDRTVLVLRIPAVRLWINCPVSHWTWRFHCGWLLAFRLRLVPCISAASSTRT